MICKIFFCVGFLDDPGVARGGGGGEQGGGGARATSVYFLRLFYLVWAQGPAHRRKCRGLRTFFFCAGAKVRKA